MSKRSSRRRKLPSSRQRRNVRRGLIHVHFPDGSSIHGNRKTMWLSSFEPEGLFGLVSGGPPEAKITIEVTQRP